jgi:CheY-like chemotaxis protein
MVSSNQSGFPVNPTATGSVSDPRPQYRVAIFGLAYKFQRLLEIVVRHARHNNYRYVLAASRGPGDYDIALVDMTVKGGAEVALTLVKAPIARPIVKVGRRNDPTRHVDDLQQRTFTMHVLGALNKAVDQLQASSRSVFASTSLSAPPAKATSRFSALGFGLGFLGGSSERERWSDHAVTAGASQSGPVAKRPAKIRALIVDDSPTVRRQMGLALQQMGIDSEGVGLAQEALDVLSLRQYDLIFSDVNMPELDGYKFTKTVKRDRALRRTPLILLTSRSSPFDLARGALSGCDSYLVKPVSLKALRETVIKNLRRSPRFDITLPPMRAATT